MSEALDYNKLAEGVDRIREVTTAMVAGLIADGFTDEHARIIVAGFFAALSKKEEDE